MMLRWPSEVGFGLPQVAPPAFRAADANEERQAVHVRCVLQTMKTPPPHSWLHLLSQLLTLKQNCFNHTHTHTTWLRLKLLLSFLPGGHPVWCGWCAPPWWLCHPGSQTGFPEACEPREEELPGASGLRHQRQQLPPATQGPATVPAAGGPGKNLTTLPLFTLTSSSVTHITLHLHLRPHPLSPPDRPGAGGPFPQPSADVQKSPRQVRVGVRTRSSQKHRLHVSLSLICLTIMGSVVVRGFLCVYLPACLSDGV